MLEHDLPHDQGHLRILSSECQTLIHANAFICSPTQVLYELLLNSIDGGATKICVGFLERKTEFCVIDNGNGVAEDDFKNIGQHHYTSRIRFPHDLTKTSFYGYRGESLACISDVSRLELASQTVWDGNANIVVFDHGKPVFRGPHSSGSRHVHSLSNFLLGKQNGSWMSVMVSELFTNEPVRRGYLQLDNMSGLPNQSVNWGSRLKDVIKHVWLLCPQIEFEMIKVDSSFQHTKQLFKSLGNELLLSGTLGRLLRGQGSSAGVTMNDTITIRTSAKSRDNTEDFQHRSYDVTIDGVISCLGTGSSLPNSQYLFVNGKLVLSTPLHGMLATLWRGMKGNRKRSGETHAVYVLRLGIPPLHVDLGFDESQDAFKVGFNRWDDVLSFVKVRLLAEKGGERASDENDQVIEDNRHDIQNSEPLESSIDTLAFIVSTVSVVTDKHSFSALVDVFRTKDTSSTNSPKSQNYTTPRSFIGTSPSISPLPFHTFPSRLNYTPELLADHSSVTTISPIRKLKRQYSTLSEPDPYLRGTVTPTPRTDRTGSPEFNHPYEHRSPFHFDYRSYSQPTLNKPSRRTPSSFITRSPEIQQPFTFQPHVSHSKHVFTPFQPHNTPHSSQSSFSLPNKIREMKEMRLVEAEHRERREQLAEILQADETPVQTPRASFFRRAPSSPQDTDEQQLRALRRVERERLREESEKKEREENRMKANEDWFRSILDDDIALGTHLEPTTKQTLDLPPGSPQRPRPLDTTHVSEDDEWKSDSSPASPRVLSFVSPQLAVSIPSSSSTPTPLHSPLPQVPPKKEKPTRSIPKSKSTLPRKKAADSQLNVSLSKEALARAVIVGQANSRFILCINTLPDLADDKSKRKKVEEGVVFAFDQHAVSERIRFEFYQSLFLVHVAKRVQINTNLNEINHSPSSLFSLPNPPPTPDTLRMGKSVAPDHLKKRRMEEDHSFSFVSLGTGVRIPLNDDEIEQAQKYKVLLNAIGYQFSIPPQNPSSRSSSVHHCILTETPIVFGVTLPTSSFRETIHQIEVSPQPPPLNGTDFIPSPIKRVIASRSCRGAVMFGDPLNNSDCTALMTELTMCAQPFQCAHGRNDCVDALHVRKVIGKGGFGLVSKCSWKGLDLAMKRDPKKHRNSSLKLEATILQECQGLPHFPLIYHSGVVDSNTFLTMELLGNNLRTLSSRLPSRTFSAQTVAFIGLQCLESIQLLHSKGYVHRDIKPRNFVVGRGPKANTIFLIDFGLAKPFNPFDSAVKRTNGHGFRGTIRYASVSAHRGYELCPVDDLWSLLYTLVFLSKGELPWSDLQDKQLIYKSKHSHQNHSLVSSMPSQYQQIVDSLVHTRHRQAPDYTLFRTKLLSILAYSPSPSLSLSAHNSTADVESSPFPSPSASPALDKRPEHQFSICCEWTPKIQLEFTVRDFLDNESTRRAEQNMTEMMMRQRRNSDHSHSSRATVLTNPLEADEARSLEGMWESDEDDDHQLHQNAARKLSSARRRHQRREKAQAKIQRKDDDSNDSSREDLQSYSSNFRQRSFSSCSTSRRPSPSPKVQTKLPDIKAVENQVFENEESESPDRIAEDSHSDLPPEITDSHPSHPSPPAPTSNRTPSNPTQTAVDVHSFPQSIQKAIKEQEVHKTRERGLVNADPCFCTIF
ncbi:putative Tau-tubulin kinase 1 [Blattamonas nauphoetae]|uniref:Tau-tubulin kinase 1 n=1 Tax=Blattamonas nauphoetae TaxID=2049346 RepID=A0ABQ9X6W1_9EUKA|nr:putative Tau-tubulin kinase 1 [Blattamonas nauphoetae]